MWRARRSRVALWVAALSLLASHAPARAVEIVVSAGNHDTAREHGKQPVVAGIGWRLTGIDIWHSAQRRMTLVPAFGALGTEEEAYYGWAGGALIIPIGRWELVPEAGAGYYQQGNGKDLGGPLEFRTGLELTYRSTDAIRIGGAFYHLSNAGLHELNPGVNSVVLTFGVQPKPRSRSWDTGESR